MPFTDARQGPGTMLLGVSPGTEYGFQVSSLTLTPAFDETEGTPTLAEPAPPPDATTSYTLDGTAIMDYTDPLGLSRYCFDNDGTQTDFAWTPHTPSGTEISGQCIIRAFPIGGDVGVQATQDFSFPVVGKPTIAGDLPLAQAAESGGKRGSK